VEKICLNVTEVAEVLGVSRPTVYQLLRRADFPSFKVGNRTLVPKASLENWVINQSVERQEAIGFDTRA
jgi:excisionase family DNA binding protein